MWDFDCGSFDNFQSYQSRQINPDDFRREQKRQENPLVSIVSIQTDQSRRQQTIDIMAKGKEVSIVSIQTDQSRLTGNPRLRDRGSRFNRINPDRSIPTWEFS